MADLTTITRKLDGTGLSQVWAAIIANFVKQEAGKGLSANDFTDTLLQKLNGIAEGAQVNVIESVKVNNAVVEIKDKIVNITVPTGSLAELNEVSENELSTALAAKINGKVDAVEGKGLSTNDYDDAAVAEVAKVKDKVDKVEGKGLSTNDYDNAAVAEVAKIAGKANAADVYTRQEADTAIDNKVKAAVAGVYKVKGSVAFASLPALGSEGMKEGHVYNVTDAFTTTDDFLEGAGGKYPAGTNVVVVNEGNDETPAYKFDCMSGVFDFTDFVMREEIQSLTADEIAKICVIPEA